MKFCKIFFINKRGPNSTKSGAGFTLMEIMVAAVIFAIVAVALLSLFNYVLKINRRSEALKQAAQGMRNFAEFLVKEVRNGQIDYYITGGKYDSPISASSPCVPPGTAGASVPASNVPSTYNSQENKLGIINTDNQKECFYYGDDALPIPNYVGAQKFTAPAGHNYTLVMQKAGVTSPQVLSPPNLRLENLMFLIRPLCDPYTANCQNYSNSYAKIQPVVVIIIKFVVQLPTGETVPIYYQTSVSSNKYDIPNQ